LYYRANGNRADIYRFIGSSFHNIGRRSLLWGVILLMIPMSMAAFGSSAQQATTGPLGDYGDAPDELSAGYAHTDPQTIGSFPTIFSAPQDPSYILHRFPQERVYLGQKVTVENNALLVDRDLDDGWVPGSFLTCSRAHLSLYVTVPTEATAGPIYLNVLFDWDHDGRWADSSTCATQRDQQAADEWAIRNLPLHQQPYSLAPGFSGTVDLPEIITGPLEGELWVRVTISTEPVDERVFVPVAFGGRGWNGQGDFLYGETEDYFSCLLVSSVSPWAGCPRPLTDQPPIDQPPSTTQNNQNNAPIANDDTAVLSEGASAVIEVLSNDSDPDNDSFSIVDVTRPAHGSVTINPNGTVTYIPEPGFSGTDSFTYTICDTSGLCDSATVTITVNSVNGVNNDPPDANDDTVTTNEDMPVTIAVLANDTDVDGDPLTITGHTQGANGTVSCTSTQCTYTPNANFNGTDTFTYTISDGKGGTDTATVTVTASPVNDAPIAQPQSLTTNEDAPRAITLSCTDIDSSTLSFSIVASPAHGSLSGTPPNLTYTPNPNFNGDDSFTFKCNDGQLDSNIAVVTVTISPVNDPPTLAPISDQSVNEGQTLILNVSCTDIDGGALTLTASNLPPGATFTDHGNGTSTLTYTPGFDTVQHPSNQSLFSNLTITCSDGTLTDTRTFNLTVHDVNRTPDAVDDSVTTNEDTSVTVAVLANDTDVDGDPLTITGHTQGANGTVSCTSTQCTYTPNANFNGTDTFTYTISDGKGGTDTATVTITITSLNDPPQADNLTVSTPKNTPITVTLPVRDDDGDPLTCSLVSPPTNGTVTVNANCTATYTPNSGFVGTDRFDYRVSDGQATDEGHVQISVLEDASWDKSSLTFISAGKSCEGKTVFATVKNVGSPMQGTTQWELYYSASGDPKKNGVLIASGTIPALASDQEFTILMNVIQKGNYKFRALQRPGHPGKGDLWSDTINFDCD